MNATAEISSQSHQTSAYRLTHSQFTSQQSSQDFLPGSLTLYVSLVFAILLTVAEIVTALIEPQLGLFIHSSILILSVFMAAEWWDTPIQRVLTVFMFAPMIRLLSLSLPLVGYDMPIWWIAASVPLFLSAIIAVRTLGLSWHDIGHHPGRGPPLLALIFQLMIAAVGIIFGLTEYYILRPAPLVSELSWATVWFPAVVLLFSTGYLEELLFRGLMQHVARERLGPWISNVIVSLIFAGLHIGYLSLFDYAFVFVASLFFGWAYEKTGSLIGITIAHGLTNILLFIVLPLTLNLPPMLELPL